jgi:DNA-directed RNA polymerase specialized sigma24 family protein
VLSDEPRADSFTEFVIATELLLRRALTAAFGPERGREAAAEALACGWEHWDRIQGMANPAGYLYRLGRDRARRMAHQHICGDVHEGTQRSAFRAWLRDDR